MRNKVIYALLCGLIWLAASCSEDTPALSVQLAEGESVTVGAEAGATSTLSFTASQPWKATVSADWLEVSPASGDAGEGRLTFRVTRPNDTGEPRSATVALGAGEETRRFEVRQEEFIRVYDSQMTVAADGGEIEIIFVSSLAQREIGVFLRDDCEWLTTPPETKATGEVREWGANFVVLPNETTHTRSTSVYLGKLVDGQQVLTQNNLLATITLTQEGSLSGESTDYSRDGEVRVVQTHSAGQGIPLVMMGDGFIDKEIDNGYYDQVMDRAVENIFTEEPIRSLRDYFDIYAVTVVSPTNRFDDEQRTALKCWMEGGNSTLVGGDDQQVQEYAKGIEGIDLSNAQIVVLLNSDAYAGTDYFYEVATPSGEMTGDFAIAYCPVIDGLDSDNFFRVLTHEVGGHGIGKLNDEYAYEESGAMPADQIAQEREQREIYRWWMNVDYTPDEQAVFWSDFLTDPLYEGQGLGVFEGACAYMSGAYRPTEESMMNQNTLGFNAPSRWAIYEHIVRRGEGRMPSREEFVSFDQQTYVAPQTRGVSTVPSRPFARPRVVTLY